ncbi:MAG: M48 family metalloprotease [Blastocatellia bacterium]
MSETKQFLGKTHSHFTIALLALALVLSGCRGSGSGGGVPGQKQAPQFKPGINLIPVAQDVQIGKQNAMQMERQMRILADPATQNYISQMGAKMSAKAPGERFPYQFKVVDTREVNAFALPGGFLYVNRGAIEAARNEAELAGVMAHEISHAALRHGTNQMSKQMIAQKGLQAAAAILSGADGGGLSGALVGMLGGGAMNLAFLKFGRTAEKEADITGAQIMASAGYDPRAMAGFFDMLQKLSGQRQPEMLSDHPDPGNRIRYLNDLMPKLNIAPNAITDTQEFQQLRARLKGAPAGASRQIARQSASGQISRPPAPSGEMATLTAPDRTYQISVPANWQNTNDGDHLIFAPEGAAARTNQGFVVTHGMFVGTYPIDPQLRGDLTAATRAFVQMQLESNPEMRPLDNIRQTSIGGRPALYTPIGGESPVTGMEERDVIVTTVLPDGRLFYIVLISPTDEAQNYSQAFERALGSIRFAQ